MSYDTLMNPAYLEEEIRYSKDELIPNLEARLELVKSETDKILGVLKEQLDDPDNETIVLTREQFSEILQMSTRYYTETHLKLSTDHYHLNEYEKLSSDVTWKFMSKLYISNPFLRK